MARAAQDERLLAVEGLLACGKRAAGAIVVDIDGNVDVDAAERVDRRLEAVEVDFHIVGYGHAREFGDRRYDQVGTAVCSGRVDLVGPDAVDVDVGVALDGDERRRLLARIDAHEDHRVAAELVVAGAFAVFGTVDAHDQHVERFSGVGRTLFAQRIHQIVVDARAKLLIDRIGVEVQRDGRDGADEDQGGDDDADDARDAPALPIGHDGAHIAYIRPGRRLAGIELRGIGRRPHRRCGNEAPCVARGPVLAALLQSHIGTVRVRATPWGLRGVHAARVRPRFRKDPSGRTHASQHTTRARDAPHA